LRREQFAVCLLLAVVPLKAESEPTGEPNPNVESAVDPVTLVSLPPKPQPQKVVDKKFIAVMAALGAVKGMSFAASTLIPDRERKAGALWATPGHPTYT